MAIDGVPQGGESLSGVVEVRIFKGIVHGLHTDARVTCQNVSGNVNASGSVTCGGVMGNVSAGGNVHGGEVRDAFLRVAAFLIPRDRNS